MMTRNANNSQLVLVEYLPPLGTGAKHLANIISLNLYNKNKDNNRLTHFIFLMKKLRLKGHPVGNWQQIGPIPHL